MSYLTEITKVEMDRLELMAITQGFETEFKLLRDAVHEAADLAVKLAPNAGFMYQKGLRPTGKQMMKIEGAMYTAKVLNQKIEQLIVKIDPSRNTANTPTFSGNYKESMRLKRLEKIKKKHGN